MDELENLLGFFASYDNLSEDEFIDLIVHGLLISVGMSDLDKIKDCLDKYNNEFKRKYN